MNASLVAFVLAIAAAALITPLVRSLAVRFDLLDHALTARKIHGQPVPRLGGIAIFLGFYLALAGTALISPATRPASPLPVLAFAGGALAIALLGILDDLRGTKAWQKLAVQFAAAGLLYFYGYRIESLANPFGPPLQLGALSLPFTLLWIVGVTNAFNLIDGLDGLAGGVALIAVAVNFLISAGREDVPMMVVCAALGGAVLGFLRYNLHPASIFMGDTGSMFLGFVLATLSVQAHQKSSTVVTIIVPITALGLPILDTLLSMVRRLAGGRHVFHADRGHIHHRLLALGLTHRRAVLALYGLSALFGAMALALTYASQTATLVIAVGLVGVVSLLLSRLGYIGSGLGLKDSAGQRTQAIRQITEGLRECDPHEIWEAMRAVGRTIEADCLRLTLSERGADGETVTRSYAAGFGQESADRLFARFKLPGEGGDLGSVEFGWQQTAVHLDPEAEGAVQELCAEIGELRSGRRLGHRPRPAHAKVLRLQR